NLLLHSFPTRRSSDLSPLNSLFKIICLALALVTIPLSASEKSLRNSGEYIGLILLGAVGLMLLVGSEELLMIFIGLELLGLSLRSEEHTSELQSPDHL